jgi:hypothetical protein
VTETWTADQVRAQLRRRHPARVIRNGQHSLGGWTCVDEFWGIDLLALEATGRGRLIGYEIKTSRSDMRRELLDPSKRKQAVDRCHEFYFAVPKGLLKPDELAWRQPDWWDHRAFQREPCDLLCNKPAGQPSTARIARPSTSDKLWDRWDYVKPCPACGGKGYKDRSLVEREAPTLWVPRDVGLVEVTQAGTRIRSRAPFRLQPPEPMPLCDVGYLARWISVRPDPRHVGLLEVMRRQARSSREWMRDLMRAGAA